MAYGRTRGLLDPEAGAGPGIEDRESAGLRDGGIVADGLPRRTAPAGRTGRTAHSHRGLTVRPSVPRTREVHLTANHVRIVFAIFFGPLQHGGVFLHSIDELLQDLPTEARATGDELLRRVRL